MCTLGLPSCGNRPSQDVCCPPRETCEGTGAEQLCRSVNLPRLCVFFLPGCTLEKEGLRLFYGFVFVLFDNVAIFVGVVVVGVVALEGARDAV